MRRSALVFFAGFLVGLAATQVVWAYPTQEDVQNQDDTLTTTTTRTTTPIIIANVVTTVDEKKLDSSSSSSEENEADKRTRRNISLEDKWRFLENEEEEKEEKMKKFERARRATKRKTKKYDDAGQNTFEKEKNKQKDEFIQTIQDISKSNSFEENNNRFILLKSRFNGDAKVNTIKESSSEEKDKPKNSRFIRTAENTSGSDSSEEKNKSKNRFIRMVPYGLCEFEEVECPYQMPPPKRSEEEN